MSDAPDLVPFFHQLTDPELAKAWTILMRELRDRALVRSSNNPVADFAEALVALHFKGRLAPKSAKGWDVEGPDGTRYQVKSRRLTPENKSKQLGQIRNLQDREFEYLIAVIFDEALVVKEMWSIPHAQVEPHARYVLRTNSWALRCSGRLLTAPDVRSIQSA